MWPIPMQVEWDRTAYPSNNTNRLSRSQSSRSISQGYQSQFWVSALSCLLSNLTKALIMFNRLIMLNQFIWELLESHTSVGHLHKPLRNDMALRVAERCCNWSMWVMPKPLPVLGISFPNISSPIKHRKYLLFSLSAQQIFAKKNINKSPYGSCGVPKVYDDPLAKTSPPDAAGLWENPKDLRWHDRTKHGRAG